MNIEILYVYLHCPRNDLEQSSSRARCWGNQVQTPQPFNHLEKSLSFWLWQGLGMPLRYFKRCLWMGIFIRCLWVGIFKGCHWVGIFNGCLWVGIFKGCLWVGIFKGCCMKLYSLIDWLVVFLEYFPEMQECGSWFTASAASCRSASGACWFLHF